MPDSSGTKTLRLPPTSIELPTDDGAPWSINPAPGSPIGGSCCVRYIGYVPTPTNLLVANFSVTLPPGKSVCDITVRMSRLTADGGPECSTAMVSLAAGTTKSQPVNTTGDVVASGTPDSWGIGAFSGGPVEVRLFVESSSTDDNNITLAGITLEVTYPNLDD